ncbi:hypothetical protein M422DRAFT_239320 [Sphaerobolus stellatus SS14]|nr:hypothetical protein M422DRAFT_239320 [Sphaerobolus stellatus SS14]
MSFKSRREHAQQDESETAELDKQTPDELIRSYFINKLTSHLRCDLPEHELCVWDGTHREVNEKQYFIWVDALSYLSGFIPSLPADKYELSLRLLASSLSSRYKNMDNSSTTVLLTEMEIYISCAVRDQWYNQVICGPGGIPMLLDRLSRLTDHSDSEAALIGQFLGYLRNKVPIKFFQRNTDLRIKCVKTISSVIRTYTKPLGSMNRDRTETLLSQAVSILGITVIFPRNPLPLLVEIEEELRELHEQLSTTRSTLTAPLLWPILSILRGKWENPEIHDHWIWMAAMALSDSIPSRHRMRLTSRRESWQALLLDEPAMVFSLPSDT